MGKVDISETTGFIVCDDPDPHAGGASHRYECFVPSGNGSYLNVLTIQFQHGPRYEDGSVPGVLDAHLLAAVADRMEKFQQGTFPDDSNQAALSHVRAALKALEDRAAERHARGVLGKGVK